MAAVLSFQAWRNGRSPRATIVAGDRRGQAPRQAAPAKIGMGADTADLGEAGESQARAGHRREATVDAYADECAHLMRAREERPRLREAGEGHHLRCIVVAESNDIVAL